MNQDDSLRAQQRQNELNVFRRYERAFWVGEFRGTVSSMHLIEPKVHQLQDYWRKNHLRTHP